MADKQQKHFLAEIEEQVLNTWDKEKTFDKSLANRKGGELFNFYDGPPFANGVPHYGHLVQTTIKDSVTRYKTMQGFYVPRRVGWDTHGLPVEYAIEKEHGFKGKQDIVKFGIDKFNAECRDSVFKYKDVWEKMFRRVGRWADYNQTYATLDESYIESVWWVFKTIYDKGLVYKAFRCSPYCPRCATPLSNFELNQGYQDGVEDPSVYAKFPLVDEPNTAFLAWTTTPWTLPANSALGVVSNADYVTVELLDNGDSWHKGEHLILAKDRLDLLDLKKAEYRVVKTQKGKTLAGVSYKPLYEIAGLTEEEQSNAYQVYVDPNASLEDGTGIVHTGTRYGETDLELCLEKGLPLIESVDKFGKMTDVVPFAKGVFFKEADSQIIEDLTKKGRIFAAESFTHTYPFCWRCDTPLLYFSTDSWMVKVTDLNEKLVKNNQKISWTPGHIRDGRFGKWLENAKDWAISRNRFWGAPLPVWTTDDGETVVVGSVEELKKLAVDPSKIGDLHRPFIDDVEIKTPSGKIAKRIPEVFDCWFESGSMPYAQDHYPFENKTGWEKHFPADFIAEAIDQTRGWFYTLHVLSTALFDKPAFKDVICSGWVVAADGEKLSKRKKNYAPMDEIFDQYGVDTLRYFMASSPIVNGEDVRFSVDFLRDVQRKVFMTLNNIYSFYKLYADVDGWKPKKPLVEPRSDNLLDQWMIARLNEAIIEVTKAMDEYRLDKATRSINDLLDDASNWFVRRSRRRFWKSEDDNDKQQAYETLHYTLLRLCQLLAPFSPFLTDYLWKKLVASSELAMSVHMSDWPKAGKARKEGKDGKEGEAGEDDEQIIKQMHQARQAITEGLALRAEAKIKVRQPLLDATVPELPDHYKDVIAEELNVKTVKWGKKLSLNTTITPELKREGLMREVVRNVQNARKQAGLNVDDRITLSLKTDDKELEKAINEFEATIKEETLTKSLVKTPPKHFETDAKVEGAELHIALEKA